jgi:hypothetical protein
VPYDVACRLDDDERMAYVVIFGQLDGLAFDWRRLGWVDG